jgi:hypothetical protein
LEAEGGTQGPPALLRGALGSGDDQVSRRHVEGQPFKPGRKPRKSRARIPPLTAAERSEINATNATKTGKYAAERVLTVELCQSIVAKIAEEQAAYEQLPGDEQMLRRPPREQIHPAWYEDPHVMADFLIAAFGPRVSRNQRLRRVHETYPWEPGNVSGYKYGPPRSTAAKRRADARRTDTAKLLDCLCDHRQQERCVTARSHCDWAAASADEAPWFEPPTSDEMA